MKERLSLGLVAMVCVALLAGSAMGGSVFFSTALGVGEGAASTDHLSIGVSPNTTLTLGIWASADQD